MITDVAGLRVGQHTRDGTGVTVVVLPPGAIGAGEVRGGAPATRELALLEAARTMEQVDAVVFAGGSAFGLAAADGVMGRLADAGRGVATRGGPVPIVPAAAVFDLVASGGARPDPTDGMAAFDAASRGEPLVLGRVGAGAGATVGKWRGAAHGVAGGVGSASARVDGATVGALAVVNAIGDVVDAGGRVLAGSTAPPGTPAFPADGELAAGEHTTLVLVAVDARCTKVGCHLLAQSGHDGIARALHPAHTRYDGDLVVAVATGALDADLDRLRVGATEVVAEAVRAAVRPGRRQE